MSPEHIFRPIELDIPIAATDSAPPIKVEPENLEQSYVVDAPEIEQVSITAKIPPLDHPSLASGETPDEFPQSVPTTDVNSIKAVYSSISNKVENEESKARRACKEASGYIPPIVGGAERQDRKGGIKKPRDLGFYIEVVSRLGFTGILPFGPRPRDFVDQESYQRAVSEHMERIWKILDELPAEKINFLRRWCGPYEDLVETWQDWDKYTPEEREEIVMKYRRLFGLDP